MKLISYICVMKDNLFRTIYHTDEFDEFYSSQTERVKIKFDECIEILECIYVLNAKFVKKIINTQLYEMRVSVGSNEYRTIIFAINHENIIQATEIILLNGFLKKSNKDYEKQIKQAIKILVKLSL